MRRMLVPFVMITLFLLAFASAAGAQTKISGTATCSKPDPLHSIEVGDRPNHVLSISKTSCTWTKPMEIAGSESKDGFSVGSEDASATKAQVSGYHTSNMASGDKFYVRYRGTDTVKDGAPQSSEGTWNFAGGSGKLKGIKGKGTYKGSPNPDGTMTYEVEGEYELPK